VACHARVRRKVRPRRGVHRLRCGDISLPSCQGDITDEERRMGEWIPTSQGEWSGYWIPLWVNPRISAKKIAEYKREKTPEYFSNFVAGLPFLGGGDKVSAQTIINCLSDKVNEHSERVIIGVDTGFPSISSAPIKRDIFITIRSPIR
jgi:hypothetical protein